MTYVNGLDLSFCVINRNSEFGKFYHELENKKDFFKKGEFDELIGDAPVDEDDLVKGRLISKLEWLEKRAEYNHGKPTRTF